MNDYINNYYQIMNILDDVAVNNKPLDMQTIYQLQNLASEEGIAIEDIADANDCGECHNWKELVDCLRDQFANGDRVPINSSDDIQDYKYLNEATRLAEAIKKIASNPDTLDNFESYVAIHGDDWFSAYVTDLNGLVSEFEQFSNIE